VAQKRPLASNQRYGLIDPTWYRDPQTKQTYVCWKEDRNDLTPREPTNLVLCEVSRDGLSLTGTPRNILANDCPWEGELVEGASFLFRRGYYYLFFSGNAFGDDRYGVGVARATKLTGPYEKFTGNPILKSDDRFSGPGHQFLLPEKDGSWTIFYHARDKRRTENESSRLLMSDPITWRSDGWPSINDGTPSGDAN
jgi:beta-xylosidase